MAGFDNGPWPGDYGAEDDFFDDEPAPRPQRRRNGGGDSGSHRSRRGRRRSFVWRWRRGFFVLALLGMIGVAAGVAALARTELPDPQELGFSSYICTAEAEPDGNPCGRGNAMAKLNSRDGSDSEFVKYDDIPQVVKDAVVAAEDRDFFEHKGLDPMGIARALYRDVRGGGVSEGGSTITQQYIKQTYLSDERTIERKVNEAVLAIKAEKEMSKEAILEGYLNTIYLGRNASGIQAASQAYFGKPITDQEIGLEEAALLAGLIRAPESAEPGKAAEEATRRRGTVLNAMLDEGYITQDQHDVVDAMDLSYVVEKKPYTVNATMWGAGLPEAQAATPEDLAPAAGAEYITEYVRSSAKRKLINDVGLSPEEAEKELASGGLRIYTTIDRTMQWHAYNTVYRQILTSPEDPAAGLITLDAEGQIKAMVGGRDIKTQAVNHATMTGTLGRQTGSAFKPIALTAAADAGWSFTESYINAPAETTFPTPDGKGWEVHNYADEEYETGALNLIDATAHSSNTAYAWIMNELGPDSVKEMAGELGMDTEDWGPAYLADVLGTRLSSPLEMAEIYSVFANGGVHKEPSIISRIDKVEQNGATTTLWEFNENEEKVIIEKNAKLVTHALQEVVKTGTGTGADFGVPAAGKTGTTSDNRDAWFVGFTPQLTTAVWMGYPDPNAEACQAQQDAQRAADEEVTSCTDPMENVHDVPSVTGGSLPADIWRTYMEQVTSADVGTFNDPSEAELREGEKVGEGPPPPPDDGIPDDWWPPGLPQPGDPPGRPDRSTTTTTRGGGGGGGGGGNTSTTSTSTPEYTIPTPSTLPEPDGDSASSP